jgi:hypothetical protein
LIASVLTPIQICAEDSQIAPSSSQIASTLLRQRTRSILAEHYPSLPTATIDHVAQNFEDHLRKTSKLSAESYAEGRLDESELEARISVYIRDNPLKELSGQPSSKAGMHERVLAAVNGIDATARTQVERNALADKFIQQISETNRTAYENLKSGIMGKEELVSRVTVFLDDIRHTSSKTDPKAAAQDSSADIIAEQFVRRNFGEPNERATTIVFGCLLTDAESGRKQHMRIARKSPDKIRVYLYSENIVIQSYGYDGVRCWSQTLSQEAKDLPSEQAASIIEASQFEHPLESYKTRGAQVSFSGGSPEPFQLVLKEKSGRIITSFVDPITFRETKQIVQSVDGKTTEIRLSNYKRYGSLNFPCTQEIWLNGVLKQTVEQDDVLVGTALFDSLFRPTNTGLVQFMDYMGGLSVIKKKLSETKTISAGVDNKDSVTPQTLEKK